MLDELQIVQTQAQLTAAIRLSIPREEIRNVMGPGITQLMAALAETPLISQRSLTHADS